MTIANDDETDRRGIAPMMSDIERGARLADEMHRASITLLQEKLSASESARREAEEAWRSMQSAFERACDEADSERAAREKAERLLAECDDELENASCPPMTNETIPERIARLAGLVSSTARDEQTALEGKVAAESRLAEAEAALREMRETFRWHIVAWVRKDEARMLRHIEEIDAFLAGGKP